MATTVHQVGGYGRLGISVYTGNPDLFEAIEELVKEYARQGEEVWFGGEPYKVEEESCTNPISHNYKAEFDRLVNAVHKLKNAMLGENYYVVDSCGEPLASEIIIDEIINKEKRNSSALKRWWQNHSNYK